MGDITKAHVWETGKVFIAPLGSTIPTDVTAAWDAAWDDCGLLDGENGTVESRESEKKDFPAWGAGIVLSKQSKHKRTMKFWAVEDNDTTFALVNPGSTRTTATGITTSSMKVPTYEEFMVGTETNDGSITERTVYKRCSLEEVGDLVKSESGMSVREITVAIYADASNIYGPVISGASA